MRSEKNNGHVWDRTVPPPGEASVLLAELQHRVANEVATSIAALRLAQTAGVTGPRIGLFDQAVARLEGFGQVHSVLTRVNRVVDLDSELHRLCRGLLSGRDGLDGARLRLDIDPRPVPGQIAQRLLMVGSELIYNAIRHALTGRSGQLDVSVRIGSDKVTLTVADDGPGICGRVASSGTGLGTGIVADLVRLGNGRIECDTGGYGTTYRVVLPMIREDPAGPCVEEPLF